MTPSFQEGDTELPRGQSLVQGQAFSKESKERQAGLRGKRDSWGPIFLTLSWGYSLWSPPLSPTNLRVTLTGSEPRSPSHGARNLSQTQPFPAVLPPPHKLSLKVLFALTLLFIINPLHSNFCIHTSLNCLLQSPSRCMSLIPKELLNSPLTRLLSGT